MVKIISSKPSTLELLEAPVHPQFKRDYLGMSVLGHECTRYLWLAFRWTFTETITDRQRRLFGRGHREEPAIIENLERIGVEISGQQEEFTDGFGHIKGHCDGFADNVPEAPKTRHLLELKTMNESNFKDVCKKGVRESKPGYFGQCQVGMKGFKLKRTLFIAVNKNDDSYYVERIREDKEISDMLMERGKNVVLSELPAPRLFKSTWYLCKWCGARDVCHFDKTLDRNCRTCVHIEPAIEGKWNCTLLDCPLSSESQRLGCDQYTSIVL